MKKFIMRKMEVFHRFLSLVLVIALLAGMIPESVYAGNQKTSKISKEYTQGDLVYTYMVESSWGNSVSATIGIKNKGDKSMDNWQLVLYYNGIIDNIWNADITSNEDGRIVICAKDYNKTIKAGKSVSFGFIAHGENSQPGMPENIVPCEADTNNNTNTENNSGTSSDTINIFPEELKGLNYALLTTDVSNLNIYASQLNVTGDVHTNKTFQYSGTSIKVDGSLEASERVVLYTSSASDAQTIGKKVESAKSISMPDITNQIYTYAKENGTYVKNSISYNADKVTLNKPILTDGSATFNASQFLGKGVIYAKDSISYNISSLATPDDSKIFLASEDGNINISGSNINLNAVLYAPNGTVNINCSSLHLNGRIIAKKVCMNGSYLNINAGPYDYEMIDFLYKPELSLEAEGTFKENRKVTLTLSDATNADALEMGEISWSIEKVGSNEVETNTSFYLIDEEASNDLHKEMLFKESGTYLVTATVIIKENQSFQVTKELTITEDESPIAAFTLGSNYYYRNQAGECQVTISDNSISPDGDTILKRTWYLSFDANNNGEFEESEKQVISDENEEEITFTEKHVGKYKVQLEVQETYEDTIKKLLNEEDYLTDDTKEYEAASSVFEIGNIPPKANIKLEKTKKADIVFTVGDCDKEILETYNEKAKVLENMLAGKGVDARIETVSTKYFTAQDSFAWTEYDHYNYKDAYLPTLDQHIIYNENDIRMMGYSKAAMKDFLYIADDNSGRKTFEFDIQRDENNWHSMEGAGFLFNTTISEEENTIKGFCILVTQSGLKLVRIDCKNLNNFRNGRYNWVQNAGELLATYPMENLYDKHHIKIVINKKLVSVWDDEKLLIDSFVLPDHNYGYGYGPIISHQSHACEQQSYFTFSNITMEAIAGKSLSDIVNGYDWRSDASKFVLNISHSLVPELTSDEDLGDLAAALLKNETAFIGIGNEVNEEQYQKLLVCTEGNGFYCSTGNLSDTMDLINNYMVDTVQVKDYTLGDMITKDVTISYNGIFSDADGDFIYAQNWEYEYNPNIFGENVGETSHIVKNGNEPITQFEDTGAYAIRLTVRDNPVSANDLFDEYRLWSDTEEHDKLVVVETRPVAQVDVIVRKNSKDKTICNTNVTYHSYDEDHPSDGKGGIREEYFYYKNVKDGSWQEGRLPNVLTVGETYLVMYQVKDVEGTLSFPAVSVVKTSDLLSYSQVEDLSNPEVCLVPEKYEIAVGEKIMVEGYALDDCGINTFEMYEDGQKVLSSFGRIYVTGRKKGTIVIKGIAKDIRNKKSEKEITIQVYDNRDTVAPTAEITSPLGGSDLDFDKVQIVGTAKDETSFKGYTLAYKLEQEEEYHIFKESDTEVTNGLLGELDISMFPQGTYEILLTVEDTEGNQSYFRILLYVETGISNQYELISEITEISYDPTVKQVNIYGTVRGDEQFEKYTLSLKKGTVGEEMIIAEGTQTKENERITTINSDNLDTGTYHLVLTAHDKEGNVSSSCGSFNYKKGEDRTELDADVNAPTAQITR